MKVLHASNETVFPNFFNAFKFGFLKYSHKFSTSVHIHFDYTCDFDC